MTIIQEKAGKFLAAHGMAAEAVNLRENADVFIGEMERGLKGEESSLFMIPTYISIDKQIPAGERIIVVDAGGTNFRVATVVFDEKGNASIDDFNNYPMPGTQGEITIEEFFDTAAEYLEPVIDKSDKIGFCFSYPTEIYPNRDGRLIRFVKEVKVKGSGGAFIGKGLLEAVKARGHIVELTTQDENTLKRWIQSILKREGKIMSDSDILYFLNKVGTDMENIDKELEKLLCYCMDKDVIELSDVETVTTEQITNKVFEMVDAIASHKQKRALELYYDLLALKEPAMRIMYLISRQFNILMNVKAMTNKGFGNKDIASKAGCPEWAVRKYQAQCRAYSLDDLKRAVRDGVAYEEAVKTGRMNDQMAVELFIVQYSADMTGTHATGSK